MGYLPWRHKMNNQNKQEPTFCAETIKHPNRRDTNLSCDGRCYACEPMARGISVMQCTLCMYLSGADYTEVHRCVSEMTSADNAGKSRCLHVFQLVSTTRRDKVVRQN